MSRPASHPPRVDGVAWVGLAFVLAPVLLELWGHTLGHPWARYALLFLPLTLTAALLERRPPAPGRGGGPLLLAGLGIELFALVAGPVQVGRLAIPLCVLGLARALGRPSLPVALLALWAIPIPNALLALASTRLEHIVLALAAWGANAMGFEVQVAGARVAAATGWLAVNRGDGGLPLAALLTGIAWYAGARAGGRTRLGWAMSFMAGGALLALPVQIVAVLAATAVLVVVGPLEARAVLTNAPWVACTLLGLVAAEVWVRTGSARPSAAFPAPEVPPSESRGPTTDPEREHLSGGPTS